jgi:uncharacterized protein
METTRQLYELQELDIEIEQKEQSLAEKTARMSNRETLDVAGQKLASAEKQLDHLKKQRRDAEGQVDDVLVKIKDAEQKLYGGKVTNPKELSNLQHEINTLKTRSDELQNNALSTIELVEAAERNTAAAGIELKSAEVQWQHMNKHLAEEIEQLNTDLTDLKPQRSQMAGEIDPSLLPLYEKLRRQKKQAVARVEKGTCRSCRISLSSSQLQAARSGQPVQCSSCGRILFIP